MEERLSGKHDCLKGRSGSLSRRISSTPRMINPQLARRARNLGALSVIDGPAT